ncbi:MAG: hypothetical protein MUF31_02500 [Akkermansiaceae bacterium]|jgi:3-deoxy-D-manno-octulosonic-acid transferase|nr:hypothetical protein [Akkermansiaceae bacterium]
MRGLPWPLWIYRVLLPVYVLVAFPAWWVRMVRRGGWGVDLWERFAVYRGDAEFEPCGAVHVHAVSVGEALLALKLIRAWRERDGGARFVLAVATASAKRMLEGQVPEGVRLVYQPVDFRWAVRRYLDRFEPAQVVLVEGEMWPHLLLECERRGLPVRLVNARMSPRSKRRYSRLAFLVRPFFRHLDRVAVQEPEDAEIWEHLGVATGKITVAGSMKFDPSGAVRGQQREEFRKMVDELGRGRRVVMAASTHAGEEKLLVDAIHAAGAFAVVVPRHAERRHEIAAELEQDGKKVVLRSRYEAVPGGAVLVVDSTGELKDWIEQVDLVIVGKSFLGTGGQNPAEAVMAGKAVVFGPHMENFEPLATSLVAAGGARRVAAGELQAALTLLLADDAAMARMVTAARGVLSRHEGATQRLLDLLGAGDAK